MKTCTQLIILIALTAALLGCATPYQPDGLLGGYSSIPYARDGHIITFRGNGYTNMSRANAFALLRACELTLYSGNKYFQVVNNSCAIATSSYTTPVQRQTTGSFTLPNTTGRITSNYGTYQQTTRYTGGQTYYINCPTVTIKIQCYNYIPDHVQVFDAAELDNILRAQYRLKPRLSSPGLTVKEDVFDRIEREQKNKITDW